MGPTGIRVVCLITALLLAASGGAQVAFDVWTADSGLPQNIIRGIQQTPDGYLWLATLDGLARFDGVRFTVYSKSNSPGMQSGRFTSMYAGGSGDLWMGTDGTGVTRYSHGKFTTYTTAHGIPNRFTGSLTGDGKGKLWVLAADTIVEWNEQAGRFVSASYPNQPQRLDWMRWENGGFWGVRDGVLHCFVQGRAQTYPLPPWMRSATIRNVGRESKGAFWIEMQDGTIAILNDGQFTRTVAGQTLRHTDRQGHVWEFHVGRDLRRQVRVSTEGEEVAFDLLYEDREGNIWLATEGQGLYRVRRPFITSISKEQGLAGETYTRSIRTAAEQSGSAPGARASAAIATA